MTTHWHVIVNVSGYLPESDDTYPYESWEDAQSSLVDELERAWDDAHEVNPTAADDAYLEAHCALHNATAGKNFLTYTPTHIESEHDIPTAWQIVACTEDCEEES